LVVAKAVFDACLMFLVFIGV